MPNIRAENRPPSRATTPPGQARPVRSRVRRVAAAVLVAALAAGTFAAPAAATTGANLRVLAFNMHTGIGVDGRLDLVRTAAVIRASGADVVGLQEVDVHWDPRSGYADQAAELGRMLGMRVFFAPIYDLPPEPGHTERRRYGVAVLSRHPIVAAQNHLLTRQSSVDPDAEPSPAPGFAEVTVLVRGERVHVYNTHLDFQADPRVRATQAAETVAILDTDRPRARQVLTGDFNAGPDAAELAPLFARTTDTWVAANGRVAGPTFPAEAPAQRIDYVTAAGPWGVREAAVLDTRASDHRPVRTDLALRRSATG